MTKARRNLKRNGPDHSSPWKELKEIMSSYVGIVRSNVRLKRAMDRLHLLYTETEDLYNTPLVFTAIM